MTITRTFESGHLSYSFGPGEPNAEGVFEYPANNPNGVVAKLAIVVTMTDDSDGTELTKTVEKETYNIAKMRKWGKRVLGLATGDSDGFPSLTKIGKGD